MSPGQLIKTALFLLGVLISSLAFLVDKATSMPRVLLFISPDAAHVTEALRILDRGATTILPLDHPGAAVLLKWWRPQPPPQLVSQLSGIGRSGLVTNIISGTRRYELRLFTSQNQQMAKDYIWNDLEAREILKDTLDKRILHWSIGLFTTGVVISAGTFFSELYSRHQT
jgi:hypothetical protein